jgi:DNA-binding NarL/FixJ family response regulator
VAAEIRVALVGGSDLLRQSRRQMLASIPSIKVVHDSDGFGLAPADLIEVNFDVAVIELRLEGQSALDYIKSMFVLAKIANQSFGRILIISQFSDEALRLNAIAAGAVDCVFVSEGVQSLLKAIEESADEFADYAIRELLPALTKPEISKEEYQQVSVALDTLDEKEAKILKGFCELKSDAQISSAVHVPKLKVRQTLAKVQKLLLIDTRSQLLLKMFSLGALAL